MGLKDLFDIALTTLAFLSFGMFILQVIMCVTMVSFMIFQKISLCLHKDSTCRLNQVTQTVL